jgi:hypothetical protein
MRQERFNLSTDDGDLSFEYEAGSGCRQRELLVIAAVVEESNAASTKEVILCNGN